MVADIGRIVAGATEPKNCGPMKFVVEAGYACNINLRPVIHFLTASDRPAVRQINGGECRIAVPLTVLDRGRFGISPGKPQVFFWRFLAICFSAAPGPERGFVLGHSRPIKGIGAAHLFVSARSDRLQPLRTLFTP